MTTILRYTLTRLRGQIIGWGLSVAALGLTLIAFYDVFADSQGALMQMIEAYPPEILAFFGGDATTLLTPAGFLGMYGFSMLPPLVGIFAVLAGSGLLASDEESGRLDLILAHPVSRTTLFWGRALAYVVGSAFVVLLGWLGFSVLLGTSSLDVSWGEMALPFVSLLAQIVIFGALALVLSLILPARRLAAMAAGAILVTSYFATSMAFLDERLEMVAKLLPYHYFQGGDAISGLDWTRLLGLLGASALLLLVAWWLFMRRDVRVVGEGSWRLPLLSRLRGKNTAQL